MSTLVQTSQAIKQKKARKDGVYEKTIDCFAKYKKFLVVDLTNISSRQVQLIRDDLRGKGDVLMGKNTTIKVALRKYLEKHPEQKDIEEVIKNNVAVIFTNGPLSGLEKIFDERKVYAVAKPGNVSQCDLWIEPVQTGLGPGSTAFFQALGIVTKITKGKVEILSRCQALSKGKKVGHSESVLLSTLEITPFVYKVRTIHAYADGKFFDVGHLSITGKDVEQMLQNSVSSLAALALGAGYVTESTVGQEITQAVRETFAIAAAAGYEMPELSALLEK